MEKSPNPSNDEIDEADTDMVMESLPLGSIKRRKRTERQESIQSSKRQQGAKVEYTKIWSESEKQVLLNLLYEYGDSDLEILAAALPNKHANQIKTYLRTIARRAYVAEESRKKNEEIQQLEKWVKFLKHRFGDEALDETVPLQLLKMSQEYGKRNPQLSNLIVDFQKAYEYLFALSVGRKIDIDEHTYYFVHSYLDWFLNQFNKYLLKDEVALLSSALNKVKDPNNNDSTLTPSQVLSIIFPKVLLTEQYLSYKFFLKSVCRKIRNVNFKKGDDYDRKISLLRAEVDEEQPLNNFIDSPSFSIPNCGKVDFKNLPSFVWPAIFNMTSEDLIKIAP